MAELEARREARRRRILENSERRLLRITGRDDATDAEYRAGRSGRTFFSAEAQEDYSLGRNADDAITDHRDEGGDRTANRRLAGSYDDWSNVPATSNSFRKDDADYRGEGARSTSHRWLRSDDRSTHEETYAGRSADDDVSNSLSFNPGKTFFPSAVLSNRVNYVLLATLVNVLLIVRMDHLFGKTIVIPYLAMMLARVLIYSNPKETTDGSLLVAALILCNVKPEVTYRVKRLMAIINIVLGDLALYIFSFTLIYCGISYCLSDSRTTSGTIEREL